MKSVLLPALGLAAALILSPVIGTSTADAAPVHHKHVVHHPRHKVVHHAKHRIVHHPKHKIVHHAKLVHHKKGVHGVPNKAH